MSAEPYEPRRGDYIRVQGNSRYLPVPARVQWMRGAHPEWTISTEVYALDWAEGYVIMRAEVRDESGRLIAQGTKHETRRGFADFIEKAETGAVGRALARAGYGTEDALDLEGDRLADAPIESEPDRGGAEQAPSYPRDPVPAPERDHAPPRGPAPAPRTPEETALLDELLAVEGMTHARLRLLADAVGIEKGAHATAEQLRDMLHISRRPPVPGPEGWPKPNTAAYRELGPFERATAREWWAKQPKETTSDDPRDTIGF